MQVATRHFNVAEYYQMARAGVLTEDERVELIRGEIVAMSPIGSRHAGCVKWLNRHLNRWAHGRFIISVQDPIHLDDDSEPQPDIAILKPRDDLYSAAHPMPGDVLLIIEVADTSLGYDREEKVPLYASAGIPEMWLVNLSEAVIEVYSNPVDGVYSPVRQVARGGVLDAASLPELSIRAADILGR